jgi:hypothetical protein
MKNLIRMVVACMAVVTQAHAQDMHDHGMPLKLGTVSFPISCKPAVQQPFNRAVALLHSFAYGPARQAFAAVAAQDPQCAMAQWGVAMTSFHAVWAPALPPESFGQAQQAMLAATRLPAGSAREQGFIRALGALFATNAALKPAQRTLAYEQAMAQVARDNPGDVEAQVFYALSLLANAPPADKTHARQKQAVALLEPLFGAHPDHPGLAHYLIHACDSTELAQRGLPAARKYASIAPAAPHALHMPSHIFTRLGLWDDSIRSNLASRAAAHEHGDTMGELHAMDYLVYAYLQAHRGQDARQVVSELGAMANLDMDDFAIAYAATAMPIRIVVEEGRWNEAANVAPPAGAPGSVVALAVWARGMGLARSGHAREARAQADELSRIQARLKATGDDYWSLQTGVLATEVLAWSAQADGDAAGAVTLLADAADREDAVEKRPVTPGPVLPAREQLGDLLLAQKRPDEAATAFRAALLQAPNRAGAVQGAALAAASVPPAR